MRQKLNEVCTYTSLIGEVSVIARIGSGKCAYKYKICEGTSPKLAEEIKKRFVPLIGEYWEDIAYMVHQITIDGEYGIYNLTPFVGCSDSIFPEHVGFVPSNLDNDEIETMLITARPSLTYRFGIPENRVMRRDQYKLITKMIEEA